MIIRDRTNPKVERQKEILGLTGDVYIDDANHIESLYSHQRLLTSYGYPTTATTIEEAEAERPAFEAEMERRREKQQEEAVLREKAEAYDIIVGGVEDESD
jgi:hypothetical protein